MSNPPAQSRTPDQSSTRQWQSPWLLLITGAFLAVTIILSRLAADQQAPMLWHLACVMTGAGLLLLMVCAHRGYVGQVNRVVVLYCTGAGLFQAIPTAMVYLSVSHVGAGYIALAYTFPLLLTYLLALLIGMDRWRGLRATGVLVALIGGLILAFGKFRGLDSAADSDGALWVLIASSMPLIVAAGNLYRTRFWPQGSQPLLLAGVMLLFAGLFTVPVAMAMEGTPGVWHLWSDPTLAMLTIANAAAFSLQFVAYFRLQHIAGPVYLSQIGSVAAAIGTPVAVVLLGESLPDGFVVALALIAVGVLLFQRSQLDAQAESAAAEPTRR